MKPIATAIGICALLLTSGALYAADFTWTGLDDTDWQRYDGNPLVADNWHIPGYPGMTSDADTALIDKSQGPVGGRFPALSSDEIIASLTMADGTSGSKVTITIDENDTLTVTGAFTVGDPSTGTGAESYIEKLGAGTISAGSIVIQAPTDNPTTLKVSLGSIVTTS